MNFKKYFEIIYKEKGNTNRKRVFENERYNNALVAMKNEIEGKIPYSNLNVNYSAGKGMYADVPWIAILSDNPRISPSTQKGPHVVLLFSQDGSSFYLTLGQGFTNFKNMQVTPKERNDVIDKVVGYFQNEVSDKLLTEYNFKKGDMYLGSNISPVAKGYIKTAIISKEFKVDSMDETMFYDSLLALVDEYQDIIEHIGDKSYDDIINLISPEEDLISSGEALEEIEEVLTKEQSSLRDIDITPVKVKKGSMRPNKYHLITREKNYRKTNYIQKTKDDHLTGLKGEKIALRLERERVRALNLDPDEHVRYVAEISDSYGYDIESVDIVNGKIVELFIEVKTTKDIKDTNFFVSKNEVDVSKEKKERYQVMRIYDILSVKPKYYTANGEIEENFYLDPVSYSARYKFEVGV